MLSCDMLGERCRRKEEGDSLRSTGTSMERGGSRVSAHRQGRPDIQTTSTPQRKSSRPRGKRAGRSETSLGAKVGGAMLAGSRTPQEAAASTLPGSADGGFHEDGTV